MTILTITLNPGIDLEYTIEEFKHNEILRAVRVRKDVGGKGFNVSHALIRLGIGSVALGFVGGFPGKFLADRLQKLGIETDLTWIYNDSRINTMIIRKDFKKQVKVNEPGASITSYEMIAFEETLTKYCSPDNWIIISGTLPPGINDDYYFHLINLIQTNNAKAVLDTSGSALALGIKANPYLIKPNLFELSELTGSLIKTEDECIRAIKMAHGMGAKNICLSLGKDGAIYSNGVEFWSARPPSIHEKNSVAAGDALLAGLVSALSDNLSPPQAVALGVACGTAAASMEGTSFGNCQLVENLLNKVKITNLSSIR